MTEQPARPWYETVSTSALLRAAWRAYGEVVRRAAAENGFDDLPKNGAYVIGATAMGSLTVQTLPAALGVTKQAFSQLLDALVSRGYLLREPDPGDRRRIVLVLTPRGEDAAALIAECARRADAALLETVDPADVLLARRVLAGMTAIPADLAVS